MDDQSAPTERSSTLKPPSEGRFPPGTVLGGRNRIVSLLGQGGMGEVYRADDLKLDQPVALKFLPESVANDPGGLARFLGEVKIARQISHPNICRIYDVGEVDGLHFISMEYIDGEDLASLVHRVGRVPEDQAIEIARQLCQGLAAVHEQGILHRDLKPTNLMIDSRGRARITDFGLATMARGITGAEVLFGTPAYMAPEQHAGGEISTKSDLYALGLVLYMLFTGRPAFQAESMSELVRLHQALPPPPPSTLVKDLNPMVEQVILRCLKKDPQDRPFSALAIDAALSGQVPVENVVLKTFLVSDLLGQDRWDDVLGSERARLLSGLHDRIIRGIQKKHQGKRINQRSPLHQVLFDHPIQAVHYALAYQEALASLSQGEGVQMTSRIGIHISELMHVERHMEVEALDREKTTRLSSLAEGGQILLTRSAFDLARQSSAMGFERARWLAHGKYEIEGIPEPLEIFEVGLKGLSPMRQPHESDLARRQMVQDTIAGWRPAPGMKMPQRPNWQIERKLGEGGFGEVWLATHEKIGECRVFKFCYDATSLRSLQREITLFRLLKETLGNRDDITRLLDWNFDQPPYFIESEYTEGGSLAEWAVAQGDLRQVPLETRLEIVAQVADALAAAHSVGVLHKDVKPGNVLVSTDPEGHIRAKLSDFGVGLVTEKQRLVEAGITVLGMTELAVEGATRFSIGGTHLYTAPELLEGKPATLQADVYALGVMLYQLVMGDFSRVLAPGWDRDFEDELLAEDIAVAVDGSPERRLSSAVLLAERLRTLETRRRERTARLHEREEAARAKAALIKSRQRRRVGVLAIVVLTLFAGAMTLQSRRTAHEAEVASQISDFLVDLFKVSDPEIALGSKITAREILDKGAAKIDYDLREQPEIQARLMHIMGGVYQNLGLYDDSADLLEKALTTRRRIQGNAHPDVGQSLNVLADVETKRGKYDRAEELGREALETHKNLHGNQHPDVAASLETLALVLRRKGDFDAAENLFRKSLVMRQELFDGDHADVAHSLDNLAELFMEKREYDKVQPLYNRALNMRRRLLGDEHPDVAKSLENLALVIHSSNPEDAEKLYLESLAMRRRLLGDEHPDIAESLDNLASTYHNMEQYEKSEELFNESVSMYRRLLGPQHISVANVLTHMSFLFRSKNDTARAEQLLHEALGIYRRQLGEEHAYVGYILSQLEQLKDSNPEDGNPEGSEAHAPPDH